MASGRPYGRGFAPQRLGLGRKAAFLATAPQCPDAGRRRRLDTRPAPVAGLSAPASAGEPEVLCALVFGILKLLAEKLRAEDARNTEALTGAWHELSSVDGDWRQEGSSLGGYHLGHHFEASTARARTYGSYTGDCEYVLSTFVPPGGRPWMLQHLRGWRLWSKPSWRIYSFPPSLARRLEIAGVAELAKRADPSLSILPAPRITYRPSDRGLRLRIGTSCVPRAAAFLQHLTLLIALAEIDAVENSKRSRTAVKGLR